MPGPAIADVARRFVESVLGAARVGPVEQLVTPGHLVHDPFHPDLPEGPEGVRMWMSSVRDAVPDLVVRTDAVAVTADQVIVRLMAGGTHRASPAMGRLVMARVVCWFRFEDHRIAETWFIADSLAAAVQLGVVAPADPLAPRAP